MAADFYRKRAVAAFVLALVLDEDDEFRNKRRKRKRATRQWIQRRQERGVYHQLVQELALEDPQGYRNFLRLTKEQFRYVVNRVGPSLEKKPQPFPINLVRQNVNVDERVAVTLRYLATGESFHSLEYSFRISRQLISDIVLETSHAIFKELQPEFLKTPDTIDEWQAIADAFLERWQFPNGIGAIDGKRVLIQQPGNSGE